MRTSSKKLKLWNGRGWRSYSKGIDVKRGYVAAYSRADAVRLINQAAGWGAVTDGELKTYWSGGKENCCWGNPMDGITPERGVWAQYKDNDKPVRLL